ncbi:type I secretion C-terminal target domain-containing protein [Telluria aromaticivorans]|uniref:Type I secretion C-terminal target domain-containing protein n=1 Tax=Telluria aromaticivorans TaxID=2725995 RepID=A0A7Y2P0T3_9BURK|nr:type I secretion C-terminal target domain-containing protein [Telluria aromaticivorans]NNG23159.1 type I secretion C-terminal target domain-containing protein [Telluria aromaticivorans]
MTNHPEDLPAHTSGYGTMSGSSGDVADTTPPTLVSGPADGHDASADLVFTFSEPVKLGSGTLVIWTNMGTQYSAAVAGNPHLTVSGNTIVFNPPAALELKANHCIQFTQGAILDLAGNALSGSNGVLVYFTTGISTTPVNRTGTAGRDILHGSDFADTLLGAGGEDDLYGYGGDDILDGGEGKGSDWFASDYISGGSGNDTLYGNDGYDYLLGGDGNDKVYGGDDADRLFGGAGDDLLDGGSGNDELKDDAGENVLLGGGGDDWLVASSASTGRLDGGEGNDRLAAYSGADISGGNGNDQLVLTLAGGASVSAVDAGAGDDAIELVFNHPAGAQVSLTGGIGTDTYALRVTAMAADATTRVRIADFTAGASGDRIDLFPILGTGYNGNPFGNGLLRLVAEGGATLLQLRTAEGSYQTLVELAGIAPASLARANFTGDIDPAGSQTGLAIGGTDGWDALAGTVMNDTIDGYSGSDQLHGNGGDDLLRGGEHQDTLVGGTGNDILLGGNGDDWLDERSDPTGNDRLEGGAGNDTLLTASSGTNLLDGGAGDDMLSAGNGADTLLGGDGNDTLTVAAAGNGAARTVSLQGGAGNDLLKLGAMSGAAVVSAQGGAGADTFAVLALGARARVTDFNAGEGDRLDLRALLPASLEDNPFGPAGYLKAEQVGSDTLVYIDSDGAAGNAHQFQLAVTLAGVSPTALSRASLTGGYDRLGSEVGFTIVGTSKDETLQGEDMDDTIRGNGGDDTLFGGKGNDLLEAGDTLGYGARLIGGTGNDTLRGGAGRDDLEGETGNDTLEGGAGEDQLDGGAGDDLLRGGDGNDWLDDVSGNNVFEGGNGNDTIRTSTFYDTEVLTPFFISVDGGAGDDKIQASLDTDTVLGGTGNDNIVVTGSGKDVTGQPAMRIDAGAGDDIIGIETWNATTRSVEAAGGAGRDTYLFLQGDPRLVLTITDFGAGAGGDVLDIFSLLDYVDNSGNPFGAMNKLRLQQRGSDTVLQRESDTAAVAWQDAAILRNVALSALTADNFTDGARPDGSSIGYERSGTADYERMVGGRLDDTLRGAGGDDRLYGGAGADSLYGDAGSDQLDGDAGDDRLFGGADSDSLVDDEGNNLLDGGDGNDTLATSSSAGGQLLGGAGNDRLYTRGAGGNLVLDGGMGNDEIELGYSSSTITANAVIRGGEGNDLITADLSGTQKVVALAEGGAGQDTYRILGASRQGPLTILDFQTGEGGDLVELLRMINYVDGPNPFSAGNGMRMEQRGADAVLQVRVLEAGQTVYRDVVVFAGIDKSAIGAANIVWGFNPDGTNSGRTITGTSAADQLLGGWLDDSMMGGDGADTLMGQAGDDHLMGGGGNDLLLGDTSSPNPPGSDSSAFTGNDHLEGGAGDDQLISTRGNDVLRGGDGNDSLLLEFSYYPVTSRYRVEMHGDAGDDLLRVKPTLDTPFDIEMEGGAGKDTYSFYWMPTQGSLTITDFQVGVGGDVLDAFGLERLVDIGETSPFATGQYRFVQRGADAVLQIDAGSGHLDFVTLKNVDRTQLVSANMMHGLDPTGSTTGLTWTGTAADEMKTGEWLDDVLRGGGGNDTLQGSRGNDLLDGGDGNDSLYDSYGKDTLLGGAGNDILRGSGDDLLRGGDGNDDLMVFARGATLDGGDGDDRLWLRGDDTDPLTATLIATMLGGAGDDVFEVDSYVDASIANATGGAGRDTFEAGSHYTVTDFQPGVGGDRISVGMLINWSIHNPFAFNVMRLVQDGADTRLVFDRDGNDIGNYYVAKTVMTLVGVNAASITVDNILEKFSPQPGTPVTPPPPPPPPPPPVVTAPPVISVGGTGSETLTGGTGNDRLDGGAGNDVLVGGAGSDTLIGGAGLDSARYGGAASNYTVVRTADGFKVSDKRTTGGDGSDTLQGVERITFADGAMALDIDGVAGQAFRIYRAAFDRTPDLGGMGFWLASMDKGATVYDLAVGFVASKEFADLYGAAPTNAELVTRLYTNILHRAPEAAGYAYWLDILDSKKADLVGVLALISESGENVEGVAELIANGIPFTPYG